MSHTQIALYDRSKPFSVGSRPSKLLHTSSRLFKGPRHRFDKQVILALEMPIKAAFLQPNLVHHSSDAARVSSMFTKRTRRYRKNLLVSFSLVFRCIPHCMRVRPYS